MTTMADPSDRLVRAYLTAVEQALGGLPDDRRVELLSDLRHHIEAERGALDPPSEAGLRAILDRLGEPRTLAAAARAAETGPMPEVPVPAVPVPTVLVPAATTRRRMGPLGWVLISIGAVLLVCVVIGALVVALLMPATGGGGPGPVLPGQPEQTTNR